MLLLKIGCVLQLVFWTLNICAQEFAYINYGVEDGLPSSEVYQSIQDNRGYMWFGTDRGLVRFNGYDFMVFTVKDGLESDVIFGFHKDHRKKVWFYTYSGGIGYLDGDRIVIPVFNDKLKKCLGMGVIGSMYIDLNDTIWLSEKGQNRVIKIAPGGTISEYSNATDERIHISRIDSGGLIFGCGNKFMEGKQLVEYYNLSASHKLKVSSKGDNPNAMANAIMSKKNVYCTLGNAIIEIQNSVVNQSARLPGYATMSLFQDSDHGLWVGLFKEGAVQYSNSNLDQKPNRFLAPYSVSSIYQSKDGAFWFTTLEAGIFFTSGHKIYSGKLHKKGLHEQVISISVNDQLNYIGTKQGKVYEYNSNESNYKLLYDNLGEVRFIFLVNGISFLGINSNSVNRNERSNSSFFMEAGTAYCSREKDSLWIYTQNRIDNTRFKEWVKIVRPPENIEYRDIEAICRWRSITFVGGRKGLFKVYDSKIDIWKPVKIPEDTWVTAMDASIGHLFLATKNHGLIVLGENGNWSVTESEGLTVDHLETVAVENDSILWVGSKKGVSKIILNHDDQRAFVINVEVNDGLISNEVNQLCVNNGKVWVATNVGLSFFDKDESFQNPFPPDVYIEQINVNGNAQDINLPQKFTDESVVFDFNFIGLNYKSLNRLIYKYRLKEFDADWNFTKNRQVRYILPPGRYTFEVLARNNSGVWSETPAVYKFEILPPFWLRSWFLVLISVLFLGGIIWGIRWRWNSIEKRRELDVQMAKSKHAALTSQLKPHFVFNALNSIHNFIRKNDKEASGKYIILFSKLIRQILDNSNESFISVDQELSLLEKYMQIEKLRFKEKLSYEIIIDKSVDRELMKIPTQIIQPYVENAIWHGIMNKEGNGSVRLNLLVDNGSLICIIEDDGIGREAANKIKRGQFQHKSSGMNIGIQRLALVEAMLKKPVSIRVTDITDKLNTIIGTRVELILPILKNV